jgi:hypothetical protein
MTYTDWRADTALAAELKKILDLPIMKQALSVVDGLTAAKVLGSTNALVASANNAHVLFGFDAGRASIINDLHGLAVVPEEIEEINPSYQGEF